MTIIIPERREERSPEVPVGEVRERAARAVADVMFERRKGRTLMAWGASPERAEALTYVDAVIGSIVGDVVSAVARADAEAARLWREKNVSMDNDRIAAHREAAIREAMR